MAGLNCFCFNEQSYIHYSCIYLLCSWRVDMLAPPRVSYLCRVHWCCNLVSYLVRVVPNCQQEMVSEPVQGQLCLVQMSLQRKSNNKEEEEEEEKDEVDLAIRCSCLPSSSEAVAWLEKHPILGKTHSHHHFHFHWIWICICSTPGGQKVGGDLAGGVISQVSSFVFL